MNLVPFGWTPVSVVPLSYGLRLNQRFLIPTMTVPKAFLCAHGWMGISSRIDPGVVNKDIVAQRDIFAGK
jgi:hypothetical protein